MFVPKFIEFDIIKYITENLPVAGYGMNQYKLEGKFTMSEHRVNAIKHIIELWKLVYGDTDTKVHFIPHGDGIPSIFSHETENYTIEEHHGEGYTLILCIDYYDNQKNFPCITINESDFEMHEYSFRNNDTEKEKRNLRFFNLVKDYINSITRLLYPEGYYQRKDSSSLCFYDYILYRGYMYHPQFEHRRKRYIIGSKIVDDSVIKRTFIYKK